MVCVACSSAAVELYPFLMKRVAEARPTLRDLEIMRRVLGEDDQAYGPLWPKLLELEKALRDDVWSEDHQKKFVRVFEDALERRDMPEVFEILLAMSVNKEHFQLRVEMTIMSTPKASRGLGASVQVSISSGEQFDSRFVRVPA